MAMLRLTLLGGFEARTDSGLSLPIPRRKAQMLLAYLAMHPRQSHLRDKLATLLWDHALAEQARQSLRQTLFAIRQALPSDPVLLDGDHVAFAAEAVTVDVSDFEQFAQCDDPKKLERAASLYQGDLLEGLGPGSALFEEWLRTERERLHELALEAFAKLLAHRMKLGATESAIQTALRLLSLDPLQEVTHRALMRLYAGQGRRAAALRQYQLCVDVLQHELGVEPEEATKQVYRELLPQPSPRPTTAQADAHPLPQRRRRHRPSHHRSRPVTAPLIGRDKEVDRLTQALANACASHGQTIALLGEAGIGKTRLITALQEATARRGAQALIGRSYETERLLAFGPWVQALREAGIVEGRGLDGLGAGWIADLSYLFPELRQPEWPLPSEPIEALRLFDAMTELVKSLAARQPLVLVLEDLHWADEMSVRLFSFLGRRLKGRRILLVGTVREEELDGAAAVRRMLAELSQEERLIRLALAPLSREHTRVLVRNLAEGGRADEASLARLEDRVWTLSEGNPFVIVESLREALNTARRPGPPDLPAVPEKVRELILGRFERLGDAGQHLLAAAAVIGRDFEFRLLQRAADVGEADAASAVEALVRTHILHSVGERFDFTHDRLREVAYGRLLPTRRRILHASVVAALEDVYAGSDTIETTRRDRLNEHGEQLAHHALRAEMWEKAVTYLRRAGLRAMARGANREAFGQLEQALGALRRLPETRATIELIIDTHIDLRNALFLLGDWPRMGDHLHQAELLARTLGDPHRLGQIATFLMNQCLIAGHFAEAVRFGQEALSVARTHGDRSIEVIATTVLGQTRIAQGEFSDAATLLKQNVAALEGDLRYERFGMPVIQSAASGAYLADALAHIGRFDEAIGHAEVAVHIAEAADHPFTLYRGLFALGLVSLRRGDLPRATRALERYLDLSRTWQIVVGNSHVAAVLGVAHALAGRADEALPLVAGALEDSRSFWYNWPALVLLCAGMVSLWAGRIDEADSHAREALALTRRLGARGNEAHALCLVADVASTGGGEDAPGYYREALALADKLGMRPLVAHCHLGLGKLHRRTSKREQAQEHLTTATTMYREMDMTYWLEKAEAEIKEIG
jgi:DNA-binding SARP family transcriptional activator